MSLREKYYKEIAPALQKLFELKSPLAAPRLLKVTLNIGINATSKDDKFIEVASQTLERIAGQRPIATKARKSIAGFKIREGMPVGLKVTLRGKRMYDFVEKLVKITLPRVRDFRGLPQSLVDRTGGISIGFREHLAFPEINPDEVDQLHGLEVVISSSGANKEEGLELYKLLGFPFQEK